jgi:uracil-DNA glycosylase family 4
MKTLYQKHATTWRHCTKCSLCHNRKHVVLAKGKIPCDILLIGEAPGQSEDAIGVPFIGPAGKLLESIIHQAFLKLSYEEKDVFNLRVASTNLVACIPLKGGGHKPVEPTVEEIKACAPRLQEFFLLTKPKLVVCVGSLSEKHIPTILDTADESVVYCKITHPAAILRADVSQRGLAIQRCIDVLVDNIGGCFYVPF